MGPSALEESSLTGRLYIIGGYLNLEFTFYGEFCKIEFSYFGNFWGRGNLYFE